MFTTRRSALFSVLVAPLAALLPRRAAAVNASATVPKGCEFHSCRSCGILEAMCYETDDGVAVDFYIDWRSKGLVVVASKGIRREGPTVASYASGFRITRLMLQDHGRTLAEQLRAAPIVALLARSQQAAIDSVRAGFYVVPDGGEVPICSLAAPFGAGVPSASRMSCTASS